MKAKRGRESIGIVFLTQSKDLLIRESAKEENKWQKLEVLYTNVRLRGLYVPPSASAKDWSKINDALKRLRSKEVCMIVCVYIYASHQSKSISGKNRGGNALQTLKSRCRE